MANRTAAFQLTDLPASPPPPPNYVTCHRQPLSTRSTYVTQNINIIDTCQTDKQNTTVGACKVTMMSAPRTVESKQAFADDVREGGFTGELTVADDLTSVEI